MRRFIRGNFPQEQDRKDNSIMGLTSWTFCRRVLISISLTSDTNSLEAKTEG
ncbi:hypothetical protein Bca4012_038242 [Brassica carinata]